MPNAAEYSSGDGSMRPKARAAAKLDVACEEGNERPVGVAIRWGRSSTAGRRRRTVSLIEVEMPYAAPTQTVARAQRLRSRASNAMPAAPVASQIAPCSPRLEYARTQRTVSWVRAVLRTRR